MIKISVAVPEDVKKVMDEHKEISWEELAQDFLWEYAKKIELADKIAAGSKLTFVEAEKIGRKIKQGLFLRYKKS